MSQKNRPKAGTAKFRRIVESFNISYSEQKAKFPNNLA